MTTSDLFWELSKIAATGFVAGIFAAWVAMRDHRFKKWWELRVAAYQNVIEALSDLAYVYNSRLNHQYQGVEPDREAEQRLSSLAQEAFNKVRKAADAGAFLFSAEANAILDAFQKELDQDYQTYFEHLDGLAAVSKTCLTKLVAITRKDLSVKWRFFFW